MEILVLAPQIEEDFFSGMLTDQFVCIGSCNIYLQFTYARAPPHFLLPIGEGTANIFDWKTNKAFVCLLCLTLFLDFAVSNPFLSCKQYVVSCGKREIYQIGVATVVLDSSDERCYQTETTNPFSFHFPSY